MQTCWKTSRRKIAGLLLASALAGLFALPPALEAGEARMLDVFLISKPPRPAMAQGVKKLEWTDLVPRMPPLKNPLLELSDDQREQFENISYFKSLDPSATSQEDRNEYREARKAAIKSRRRLEKQGINVDQLFDDYHKWQAETDRRAALTVSRYNGRRIAIAGYLLPLDFNPRGTREFLLVPYVGACIHVPPPPINQTIFVRMKRPRRTGDYYEPVWVIGRLSAKSTRKKLSLVDGQDWIDAGYRLSGEKTRKYTPPR